MAFAKDSSSGKLLAASMRPGELIWIGLRPARRVPVVTANSVKLTATQGIEGDRYTTTRNGARQVTLIAAEDIAAIAAFIGRETVAPELLRRNFVTRGVNLLALKEKQFKIGSALLEYSGECAPCSHMEEALGEGGYNAMRSRGGITARIIESGDVKIGDEVLRRDDALG